MGFPGRLVGEGVTRPNSSTLPLLCRLGFHRWRSGYCVNCLYDRDIVGRGWWTRNVRASADEISMDVEWLHATLEWLILGDPDPDVSRPTMARKAHDKIDRLAKAARNA